MRLLHNYESEIRAQFEHLILPPEGITILWLNEIKALRQLIDEATVDYGGAVPFLVASLVNDLQGPTLFAWKMATSLVEVSDAITRIEIHIRSLELDVNVISMLPTTKYPRELN